MHVKTSQMTRAGRLWFCIAISAGTGVGLAIADTISSVPLTMVPLTMVVAALVAGTTAFAVFKIATRFFPPEVKADGNEHTEQLSAEAQTSQSTASSEPKLSEAEQLKVLQELRGDEQAKSKLDSDFDAGSGDRQ